MAKQEYLKDFAFYEQLRAYYLDNKKKIRSRYNDLTRKYLSYNDKNENPNAYLRVPQFEALEMYVFIKEFMKNPQVYEMFDDWRNQRDNFSDASYYSVTRGGQTQMFDSLVKEQTDTLFKQMKNYKESYPNYIYALTMGLGKTILMATCIFYEFLLANKYPKDSRFCHNVLVFAPDKTVLESLREIMTFDKSKVVPPEYARVLDSNIKYHYLDETGTILNTIDGSDFNIIISNTQKIIVKKKRKESTPGEVLFGMDSLLSSVYGDDEDDAWDETTLMDNQRFKKLCRLPQLGVYVDEAHHLFGADLEKQIRSDSRTKTSLRDTINMLAEKTSIVACYNYTGTPYIKKQILPEVVYAYGLRESIIHGYLKNADPIAYENVKSKEFLKDVITRFWAKYGGKTYEGLNPKLAIYASTVEEAVSEVRPLVEEVLSELGVSQNAILLNVGDTKYTKNDDIRNFNNLDVIGTQGNDKQFIILVEKGKEGWNCRSLFGVAMYRVPKSKVFVLQATMRCLRNITEERRTATIYLSKDNYQILDEELNKNFNMDINGLSEGKDDDKKEFKVKVMPPLRSIRLKRIWREYKLKELEYSSPIDFEIDKIDYSKYERIMYEKDSIIRDSSLKETNIDYVQDNMEFSLFSLTGEVARYLNRSCILISKILSEAKDGVDNILSAVNKYNELVYDVVIPKVFNSLYKVEYEIHSDDKDLVLLKEPKDASYYVYKAKDELVIRNSDDYLDQTDVEKSFHADTYCFDSKPEKECFMQYLESEKVKEIYFTGMFTSPESSDLSIQYYDPESQRIRHYYPDFLAKMSDDKYRLIEVKGDNMIDTDVVEAKIAAAEELAEASGIEYIMYPSSVVMNTHILNDDKLIQKKLDESE